MSPPWSRLAKRAEVKTTRYFDEQILRKRPELRPEWIEATLAGSVRIDTQPDGRIRHWGRVEQDGGKVYMLRVITLSDGETVHNAFFDRSYKEPAT